MDGVAVTVAVLEGVIRWSGWRCYNILSVRFPAPIDPPCYLFSGSHQRVLRYVLVAIFASI